jgi:hypothetical protein
LTQHVKEEQLMINIKDYFNCGYLYKNKEVFNYRVETFYDIQDKIIPFFKKHPILGVKLLDFLD